MLAHFIALSILAVILTATFAVMFYSTKLLAKAMAILGHKTEQALQKKAKA